MKIKLPTIDQIEQNQNPQAWDILNHTLYRLCAENYKHETVQEIIGKVILISRSYSASLQRHQNQKVKDDLDAEFFIDHIAPCFQNSNIDLKLNELKSESLTLDSFLKSLELHFYLVSILRDVNKKDQRSFSSKYLHFHLPDLFFIYDTRAASALKHFVKKPDLPASLLKLITAKKVDETYAVFSYACYSLMNDISNKHKIALTGKSMSPRKLDHLLLSVADENIRVAKKRKLLTTNR
ncbi:MAG: hypothetical protein V4543_11515 [Bacteroidota bacterium]